MIRERRLAQAEITASNVAIYTVPAQTVTMMKDFDIANTTAGALTVNVYIVLDGASVGTANAMFYGYSIAASSFLAWRGTQVMEAGDKIYVSASGLGLTITASGVERRL